jgi:hypothetical protein
MKNFLRSNLLTIMVFSSLLCPLSTSSVKATNIPANSKAITFGQATIKVLDKKLKDKENGGFDEKKNIVR